MQKFAFLAILALSSVAYAQQPTVTNNVPSMPQNGQMTIEKTTQDGKEQTTVIDSGGNLKSVDAAAPQQQNIVQTPAAPATSGVGAELPQATTPNQPAVPTQQNIPQQGMPAPASGQAPTMNPPPPQGR